MIAPWSRALARPAALLLALASIACLGCGPAQRAAPPVLNDLPAFSLIERNGEEVTKSALAGRPVVVDFIFTRCSLVCPRLTARMQELEKALPPTSRARLLSISVDPDYDTPEVLRRYAEHWHVAGDRWLFATGNRQAIWELVRTGFLLPVEEQPEVPEMPILHSSRFAILDGRGRLRSTYEAFEKDALERVLADLKVLEREALREGGG